MFPEALLLHHLDNLDSKMECMRATAEKDQNIAGSWTSFNAALQRIVLKKEKYLAPAAEPPKPAQPPAPPPAPAPKSGSLFGEKLTQALKKDT